MKITAEFESTDTAERACTALKRSVSGIVGINIKGKGGRFENTSYRIYPAYSPANGNLSYNNMTAVQVPERSYGDLIEPQLSNAVTLEIICSEQSRKPVTSALINYGGMSVKSF